MLYTKQHLLNKVIIRFIQYGVILTATYRGEEHVQNKVYAILL